ncbi:MAG: SRPBCC family protein [Mycobacterium sp.]
MPSPTLMEQSRAIPVSPEDAFAQTLAIPLPLIFRRWFGPIGPVKSVHPAAQWGTVGQTRTVAQVGGGTMLEELTLVDPPKAFAYTLTDITGPLAPLVAKVEGEWLFTPVGTGTEVTWRWLVHPTSDLTGRAAPVFARMWRGYARLGLEELSRQMLS